MTEKKLNHTRIHELKIEATYLDRLCAGQKTFEIRFNDRDYQVGDYLRFTSKDHFLGEGFNPLFEVVYISNYPQGLKDGWVVLGVKYLPE